MKTQPAQNGSSRDTDSRALAACARRLDDAKRLMESDLKSKENLKAYGDAIRHNQRLWTIFQVALSDPHNPLPHELKITLLNLSRYVDKSSFRAVGKYTPDVIDSLININRIIAAGLTKEPPADSMPPPVDTREIPTSLMTSA
jgi:flagellar protein FlaF